MLKDVLVPINRAGYPFIGIFLIAAIALYSWWIPAGLLGFVLTAWCVYFFRDPDRVTPTDENLVISPADGVVQSIVDAVPPPELEMGELPLTRVAVFMNVFNVHVNRVPITGKITGKHYRPGKFLNASLDKASIDNERMSLKVANEAGQEIAFVQIAGLVARRIICDVDVGNKMLAGQRFGLIRFGSRVDVYLPKGVTPKVCVGQMSIAGETVLADLNSDAPPPIGATR